MAINDFCYLTITEAAAGLRRKEFSPLDLTRACLERIEAVDGELHSFITVTADVALKQAKQAEQELLSDKDRGPLHGIPIALKDLYATKGIRTTCHSAVLQDWVPDYNATAVTKLADAGTILLGKLGMHEFAFGGPSVDAPFPAVPGSSPFADVPVGDPFLPWINKAYTLGITAGCLSGPLRYCPNDPVTRGSMAKFIYATFPFGDPTDVCTP